MTNKEKIATAEFLFGNEEDDNSLICRETVPRSLHEGLLAEENRESARVRIMAGFLLRDNVTEANVLFLATLLGVPLGEVMQLINSCQAEFQKIVAQLPRG